MVPNLSTVEFMGGSRKNVFAADGPITDSVLWMEDCNTLRVEALKPQSVCGTYGIAHRLHDSCDDKSYLICLVYQMSLL